MALQAALSFIGYARISEDMRNRIAGVGPDADLEDIVRLGAEAGHAFTADELRAAFKHEWGMRWFHYHTRPGQWRASTRCETEGSAPTAG